MDPIERRSITIQTGVSAVKTLSISCRVFARFLACNEVLINNSWLPLIFNGCLLHGTLLDEEMGGWREGVGVSGEDKFEDTQLFIAKIYGLRAEGSRGKRRRQTWELVVSYCLARNRPLLLYPRWRKPRGPISNPASAVGMRNMSILTTVLI